MKPSHTNLTGEVEFVFKSLFGVPPTPAAIEAYRHFHDVYETNLKQRKRVDVTTLVSKGLDIEAIEFFLRRRHRGNILTCKLWICSYLYEIQERSSEAKRSFKECRPTGPIRCLVTLFGFGIVSAVKWLKGALLTVRHNLICK